MLVSRRIYWPSINLIGPGCVKEVGAEAAKLGLKKALLVTDKVLVQAGVAGKVMESLTGAGVPYVVFDEVQPNPTMKNVNDALALLKKEGCDFLVSVGGGSPQDAASAVSILATNGGDVRDYEGIAKSSRRGLPVVAVNPTAGTAAEVTVNYVITDEERKIKMVMVDPNSLAVVAVNDPELMIGKPAGLTAATGMDALTHAIEAYVTRGAYELSDHIAYKAIELIGANLRDAVKDGSNLKARSGMAWGSFVAGLSFSNCGLGIVHSMAHQLGSEYDLPHGVANAILLPYVMEFNREVCVAKFARIALALGKDVTGKTPEEASLMAVEAVKELSRDVCIPALRETAFSPKDVDKLAAQALRDVCTGGNPRDVTVDDLKALYLKAYEGA
jgi:alcohol dehydrogenase